MRKSCCRKPPRVRTMPLDAFYLGYQKSALETGEFVAGNSRAVAIARNCASGLTRYPSATTQDISAVCAAFAVTLDGTRVSDPRISRLAAWPQRPSARSNAEAVLRERGVARSQRASRHARAGVDLRSRSPTCARRATTGSKRRRTRCIAFGSRHVQIIRCRKRRSTYAQ
jgi:xanthine dehydrogenase iron-sulfur cluster and FAD-binding subunit A